MSQPQNDSPFLQGYLEINAFHSTKSVAQQMTLDFLYREVIDIEEIEANIQKFVPGFINYKHFWYNATLLAKEGYVIHQHVEQV